MLHYCVCLLSPYKSIRKRRKKKEKFQSVLRLLLLLFFLFFFFFLLFFLRPAKGPLSGGRPTMAAAAGGAGAHLDVTTAGELAKIWYAAGCPTTAAAAALFLCGPWISRHHGGKCSGEARMAGAGPGWPARHAFPHALQPRSAPCHVAAAAPRLPFAPSSPTFPVLAMMVSPLCVFYAALQLAHASSRGTSVPWLLPGPCCSSALLPGRLTS